MFVRVVGIQNVTTTVGGLSYLTVHNGNIINM